MTPWMDHAWSHVGVSETRGSGATSAIVSMYAKAGHSEVRSDEVPWCAAFVGACLRDAGLSNTGSLMARSYLQYGTKIDAPRVGCIVVMKRGAPPAGHVGFVTGWGDGKIRVLGGNQGDKVCEASYREADVLGYRWPPAAMPQAFPPSRPNPLPQSGTVWGTVTAALAGVAAYVNETLAGLLEWSAKLTEMAPVQAALASAGGNVKSISLGLGIGAAVYVVSRRVKAAQEGKAG
jgi:uncharacterized protein (TIGR02594 family)